MSVDTRIPIYFVDDDQQVLDAIRRLIRNSDKVSVSRFFDSSLLAFERLCEEEYGAIVITDWSMPHCSGVDLCRKIREYQQESGDVRHYVMMLTGWSNSESVVEALNAGADDYLVKPIEKNELIARISVGQRFIQLERELRNVNKKLEFFATTDDLTGAHNRRNGNRIMVDEIERVYRGIQGLGLLLVDIDHFKQINDTHGHPVGDAVLVEVVKRIRHAVRKHDQVIRWGGEEFLITLPNISADEIYDFAERLQACISAEPMAVGDLLTLDVFVSVGVSHVAKSGKHTIDELVKEADDALYQAKQAGRNCIRLSV